MKKDALTDSSSHHYSTAPSLLQMLQERPEPVYEEYVRGPGQLRDTHHGHAPGLGQDGDGRTQCVGKLVFSLSIL